MLKMFLCGHALIVKTNGKLSKVYIFWAYIHITKSKWVASMFLILFIVKDNVEKHLVLQTPQNQSDRT
jgi:hypothetical protein